LASRFANLYDESDRQRMKDRIFMLKHSPALRKNLNMYVWHYVFKSDSDKYSEFYQNLEDREKTQQFLYENELGYVFKTDEVETTLLLKDLTGGENCSSNKSRWYFSWAGLRGVNIEEFVSEAEIKDDDVKPDDVTKRFVKQGDSIKNTSIVFCLPTPEEFKAGTYIISKELETLTKVRDEAIQLASEMEVYLEEKIIKGKNLSESFYNDKFNNLRALAIIKD
jgi:hypothetical protein